MLLNAYVPTLQVAGQVVRFLTGHLGNPVPSPALFAQIGNRFVRDVKEFAAVNDIPILRLNKPDRSRWDDRKVDHVRPYVDAAEADGRFGVVAIVFTQEFQWVFSGRNQSTTPGVASFEFTKSSRRVGTFYFYVLDREFGVGFIKICTYFPYPAKVWVNGHEWAKRQADHAGIGFTNKSLRGLVSGLLECDYSANQMSYDLRRLRLHGLIEKIPGTNTYRTTPDGIRAAVFYTKVRTRLLGPLLDSADQPPAPTELRRALATIDRTIDTYITNARLGTAA
jgi:hypothetical protein